MPADRFANVLAAQLALVAADPGTTGTTLSVDSTATAPSLTNTTGAPTAVLRLRVDNEIMHATASTATSFAVTRGQEGSTAAAHAVGAPVYQVVTPGALYAGAQPLGINTTIPTGTPTYTPSCRYKYHFLILGGDTKLTVAAPTVGDVPVDIGFHEIRIVFLITSTALGTQPAFHATYFRSPAFSASLTANTASSISFGYRGATIAATNAWVRIN